MTAPDSNAAAGANSATPFDVAEADRLLMTTRAVRRRLDTERPVPDQVIFDCIDAAEQAPSGGNDASRRWLVIRDPELKKRCGELYAESGEFMNHIADRLDGTGHDKEQVFKSSSHLVQHFADAPVLVIAAIWGIHDNSGRPGLFDSVIQSGWSFNLALRARGLGSTWTTMLNARTDELAELVGIPPGVTTIVTFPVAYTKGTDFSAVARRPASEITYFDQWGFTRERASEDGTARLADGPGVVCELDSDARPADVWPVISDIEMPSRFGTELIGAEWQSDAPVAEGSTFTGTNKIGDREWQVTNTVTAYEEGKVFEWTVGDLDKPGGIWRLEVAEQGRGSRIRFSARMGYGSPTADRALSDPDKEEKTLNFRRGMWKENMQKTLEGVKVEAEEAAAVRRSERSSS